MYDMIKNSKKSPHPRTRKQLNSESQRILNAHALQLSEHFDSVQIIATAILPSGVTIRQHSGSGNAYARLKAVEKWWYSVDDRIE